jgi:hypothetical protein
MKKFGIEKLENFSKQEKKKYLVLPLIIATLLCTIIFAFSPISIDTKEKVKDEISEENLTMPVPIKKTLSSNKKEVSKQLEINNQNKLNRKKDFYSVYNEKGDDVSTQENLGQGDDNKGSEELIKKVKEQLNKIENVSAEKKPIQSTKKRQNKVTRTISNSVTSEQKKEAWRKRMNEENDAFFNQSEIPKENIIKDLQTDKNIYAVIYTDQKVIDRGRVQMRLSQKAVIDGFSYERNTLFYGFAKFAKNRIYVNIESINNRKVSLTAFDSQDYKEGIYTKVKFYNIDKEEVEDIAIDNTLRGNRVLNVVRGLVKSKKTEDSIEFSNEYKILLKKS